MNRCCVVLIVDDDQNLLTLWATILRPHARVKTAATFTDGLALLTQADILILDWRLDITNADPILDRWIEEKDGPVMVVTGMLTQERRYQLYARGVWNTFEKPLPNETLISVVRRYMRVIELQKTVNYHSQEIADMRANHGQEITRLKRYITALAVAVFGTYVAPEIVKVIVGLL